MKKVLSLVISLVIALSMTIMAAAADPSDATTTAAPTTVPTTAAPTTTATVAVNANTLLKELTAAVGADKLKSAFEEVWSGIAKDLNLPANAADINAADLPDDTSDKVADGLIETLSLGDDLAAKLQASMSNDFVSFLAGLYTGAPITAAPTTVTTKEATTVATVKTGDSTSSVIAISTFAAISAAAAVAFVCMKKKEN